MALNADLKIMEEANLLSSGIVKGGVDKQNIANTIRPLREKGDKKGIAKYIETLKSERVIDNTKSDPGAIAALTKLVNDQSLQVKQLTEKISALETPKGDAGNNGGNR